MAQQELEAALRRDGENQARAIWQQVEAEAAQLRKDSNARLKRQQQAVKLRRQAQNDALREAARSEAVQQALRSRLLAEHQLAKRLHSLAEQMLDRLARRGGERLFATLAAEIPDHAWEKVLVHPRDSQQASKLFPAAEILPLETISGGLRVEGQAGRIQIINSLEKRLEHLWPELLPQLLEELRQLVGDHEAVA